MQPKQHTHNQECQAHHPRLGATWMQGVCTKVHGAHCPVNNHMGVYRLMITTLFHILSCPLNLYVIIYVQYLNITNLLSMNQSLR